MVGSLEVLVCIRLEGETRHYNRHMLKSRNRILHTWPELHLRERMQLANGL